MGAGWGTHGVVVGAGDGRPRGCSRPCVRGGSPSLRPNARRCGSWPSGMRPAAKVWRRGLDAGERRLHLVRDGAQEGLHPPAVALLHADEPVEHEGADEHEEAEQAPLADEHEAAPLELGVHLGHGLVRQPDRDPRVMGDGPEVEAVVRRLGHGEDSEHRSARDGGDGRGRRGLVAQLHRRHEGHVPELAQLGGPLRLDGLEEEDGPPGNQGAERHQRDAEQHVVSPLSTLHDELLLRD